MLVYPSLLRFLQFSQCLGEESSSVLHKSNKSSAQRAIYTRIRETRRTCRIVFSDTLRRRVLRCSINGYRTKISKLVKPRLELQQQRKISCLYYPPRKNFGVRIGFQVSFEAGFVNSLMILMFKTSQCTPGKDNNRLQPYL